MPAMAPSLARGLFAATALVSLLSAHGGQYRGPGTPFGPPPTVGRPGGGPITGGPAAPSPGSPTTGSGPSLTEEVSWQVWWELNKDPFVQQDTSVPTGPATGSDDFYLGRRRTEVPTDTLLPTDADLGDRVVPALVALMDKERNRDVQTACLMALGKIGRDGPGIELEKVIAERIARDDQEVRETAVLALGVAGRAKALPMLVALLQNDAEGKRLAARDSVGDRTRTFAAYGLGLLARRSSDFATRQTAHDALWAVLRDKNEKRRDLRVAAVGGLGLLCDPAQAAHKRLAWLTVDELLEWYQLDLGRSDEAVQAHAPVAIGRLLGRGDSLLHQRCKKHFLATLTATSNRRSNPILQSAALALGMLALPAETHAVDAEVGKGLQIYFERGVDRLARYFAVMAMGRIGGSTHRTWLLEAYNRGNKTTERPWVALALGLIAAQGAAKGEVDGTFARLLLDDLPTAQKPDVQGALAVALGMTQHAPAVPTMQRLLRDNEHDETLAGYYCVGLAMLGDRSSVPALLAILERSKRRPFLLLQAAVGLGRLGDREANQRLLAMMKESDSVAVLSALANAIGQIGDRRAIDPLIEMTKDAELTKLARAFVAAALGGIGDRSPLPWNAPLGRDCNFGAPVDTLWNGSTGVLDIL
jgi:HEAT repeat protein